MLKISFFFKKTFYTLIFFEFKTRMIYTSTSFFFHWDMRERVWSMRGSYVSPREKKRHTHKSYMVYTLLREEKCFFHGTKSICHAASTVRHFFNITYCKSCKNDLDLCYTFSKNCLCQREKERERELFHPL